MSQDIATKIYNLRKEKGMTLEEVGKIVGVGKSTVRKWETGMIGNMKIDKIDLLAKALKTTTAYLMGWEEKDICTDTPQFHKSSSPRENNFAQRLKEQRTKHNLSQEDVAKSIQTSKQAIYKYENEIVTNIPFDKVEALANLFNVTPAYLVGWENEENFNIDNIFPLKIKGLHILKGGLLCLKT